MATRKIKVKRYTEADRKELRYGSTNANGIASRMAFRDLVFWLGLGILLANGYAIKATHDKITAYPPLDGRKLPLYERVALLSCGWHKDTDEVDDPCAWISFYAGG